MEKSPQNRTVKAMWISLADFGKSTTACQQGKKLNQIRVLAVIHTIHYTAAVTAVYYIYFYFLKKKKSNDKEGEKK